MDSSQLRRPTGSCRQTMRMADPGGVIVIGAGLAGLAAARELQDVGRNVLVLEARDRVGGQIWTSQKWTNMSLDLGASWIHGVTGNPLTALATEAGAKFIETSYDRNIIYNSDSDELTEDDVWNASGKSMGNGSNG